VNSDLSTTKPPKPIDVGRLLDEGNWSAYLKLLVGLAALAIIFDGIDNQLVAMAVPSLMKEWHLPRAAFSNVLAVGMFGMMLGGALAGVVGDRWGRKFALLLSVLVFGAVSVAMAATDGLGSLGALRFFAGLGLGGALPNAAALASEYVPRRQRAFAVTLTIVCVPLGGMLTGQLAASLLPNFGWRSLFLIGGAIPLVALLVLARFLAESPRFLARHPERWPQLVALLQRAGHNVDANSRFVDAREASVARSSMGALFAPAFRRDTVALSLTFFCCMLAVYAGFNWIPAMLTGSGWPVASASNGIFYFNLGGVGGALAAGLLIARFGSRTVMLGLAGAAGLSAIGLSRMAIDPAAMTSVLGMLTLLGGLINALTTMSYALAAHVYPTSVRATGVGTAIAFGRVGAVLSAGAGSRMLDLGGHGYYFALMAGAMAVCFCSLAAIQRHIRHDGS
jgi:AAHS family 4-hydroxybenzoate transporter-like MFS transporter